MPANLPPLYYEAERKYRAARSVPGAYRRSSVEPVLPGSPRGCLTVDNSLCPGGCDDDRLWPGLLVIAADQHTQPGRNTCMVGF